MSTLVLALIVLLALACLVIGVLILSFCLCLKVMDEVLEEVLL